MVSPSSVVKYRRFGYTEPVGFWGKTSMPSLLGMKINELRRALGLTLDQLAAATESSKSYMWEVENKEVARPSAEKLDKIAAALGVTSDFLIDASQDRPTENVVDRAFFRKYQNADAGVKQTLKRILDALDNDG
jgi:transcriptional regulator with XRE-family HTH domain